MSQFRILSLDGGGAKGFYTLGVLKEVEAALGTRLSDAFNLIYGTSTGAIIAALLSLGYKVKEVQNLYRSHVVTIMETKGRKGKSAALARLGGEVFGDLRFDAVKTNLGIVATKWMVERPMIFKSSVGQAHGRAATFTPGFGCTISDAVQASCAGYPFFDRKWVVTAEGETLELMDGGFCANNPTLYAIADARHAFQIDRKAIGVLSIGVGEYPTKRLSPFNPAYWIGLVPEAQLIQKTFDINTQSMEQLRSVLFGDISTVRVNEAFTHPDMATDMFEHDLAKLSLLSQRGSDSFGKQEGEILRLLGLGGSHQ